MIIVDDELFTNIIIIINIIIITTTRVVSRISKYVKPGLNKEDHGVDYCNIHYDQSKS